MNNKSFRRRPTLKERALMRKKRRMSGKEKGRAPYPESFLAGNSFEEFSSSDSLSSPDGVGSGEAFDESAANDWVGDEEHSEDIISGFFSKEEAIALAEENIGKLGSGDDGLAAAVDGGEGFDEEFFEEEMDDVHLEYEELKVSDTLTIDVDVATDLPEPIQEGAIENAIKAVLELHAIPYGEVSVVIVSDEEIRQLNMEQREIDRVTDVLSFPQYNNLYEIVQQPYPYYGDIVLSAATASRQAKEFGHSFNREVSYLTVHSMLHLLGYDHIEEDDKVEMRAMEKIVMKGLGIFK